MRENPDRQGKSGLEDHPPSLDLPEHLPQNQNLSVLLFYDFHQLLCAFLNLRLAQQLAGMDPSRVTSMAHYGTVVSSWFLLSTVFYDI